jgi:hypothetical protein
MTMDTKAAFTLIASITAGLANLPMKADAAQVYSWDIGSFYLLPYHYAQYSVNIPNELGLYAASWYATAWPAPSAEEQRVQTTNLYLIRKGGDVPPADRYRLQLNFTVQNLGPTTAPGRVVITAAFP